MTKLNLFQKLRITASLVFVFLLIFGTNRLDKYHFENVQHIMNSVYEDRIVAQHYIYQLNNLYHQKYKELPASLKEGASEGINSRIDKYIELFSTTTLTTREAQVFRLLQEKDEELKAMEAQLAAMPDEGHNDNDIGQFKKKAEMIFESLDDLSEIQLNEGGRLRKEAQDSLDTNAFYAQLELIILVFIGILIQVVLFYPPKRN